MFKKLKEELKKLEDNQFAEKAIVGLNIVNYEVLKAALVETYRIYDGQISSGSPFGMRVFNKNDEKAKQVQDVLDVIVKWERGKNE